MSRRSPRSLPRALGSEAPEPVLVEVVREEAAADDPIDRRALRIAELVRIYMGRRRVGIYRVDGDEVASLAWSGPAAPRPRSVAIIPIVREGQIIGALDVEGERTEALGHAQLGLLEQIAEALTPLYPGSSSRE
jgi:hypothetical protein